VSAKSGLSSEVCTRQLTATIEASACWLSQATTIVQYRNLRDSMARTKQRSLREAGFERIIKKEKAQLVLGFLLGVLDKQHF